MAEAKFYAPGRPPWSDGLALCGRTKRSWSRAVAPKQREATGKVVEKDAMNLWLLLRRQKEDAVWVVNNLKVRRSFKKWSMQQLTLQRLNCLRYLCKFRLSCLHNQIGTNSIGCQIKKVQYQYLFINFMCRQHNLFVSDFITLSICKLFVDEFSPS